jgi:hypothetical protein
LLLFYFPAIQQNKVPAALSVSTEYFLFNTIGLRGVIIVVGYADKFLVSEGSLITATVDVNRTLESKLPQLPPPIKPIASMTPKDEDEQAVEWTNYIRHSHNDVTSLTRLATLGRIVSRSLNLLDMKKSVHFVRKLDRQTPLYTYYIIDDAIVPPTNIDALIKCTAIVIAGPSLAVVPTKREHNVLVVDNVTIRINRPLLYRPSFIQFFSGNQYRLFDGYSLSFCDQLHKTEILTI